jgi:hypothetical protein
MPKRRKISANRRARDEVSRVVLQVPRDSLLSPTRNGKPFVRPATIGLIRASIGVVRSMGSAWIIGKRWTPEKGG